MSAAEAPDTNQSANGGGDENYQVIALRYRPQTFTDLVGQEHVWRGLIGAIQSNRVGHAYLFTGARGVGKTSTARIFSKALNCEKGMTASPCGVCDSCVSISNSSDIDVIEMDGASNRGIDEIRQLRQNASIRPSRSRFKIFIIDEVHMLTRDAFNALLKTLEEPPEHVKFIFCTTEPEKIPITILSRCQRHDFSNVETQKIAERLHEIATRENVTVEPDALSILARRAGGSMRDSQSLLEQMMALGSTTITAADVHAMLGTTDNSRLFRLIQMLAQRDTAAALGEFGASIQAGADVGQLFDQLLGSLRDTMVVAVGCSSSSLVHHLPNDFATIQALAIELGVETILAMIQIVDQTLGRLKYLSQPRTLAELALVRMSRLSELQNVSQIIGALRSGTVPSLTIEVQGSINGSGSKKKVELNEDRLAKGEVLHELEQEHVVSNGRSATEQNSIDVADSPEPSYSADDARAVNGHSNGYDPETSYSHDSRITNGAAHSASLVETNTALLEAEVAEESVESGAPTEQPLASIATISMTLESVKSAWPEVVSQLPGMLHDSANMGILKEFRAPNQVVLGFARAHAFAKILCEKPANLALLQDGFKHAIGQDVRVSVVFDEAALTAERPLAKSAPVVPRVSQQERIQQPLVKKAMDLFAGRVMRIEEPS